MVAATVRTAVDNVSQAFRDFDHPDPRYDEEGRTSRLLQMQYKCYKEQDPSEKHQKAIPFSVIRQMNIQAISDLDSAIATICTGAIFFCMRSCEYSKAQAQDDRKTKLLCLRNFRFFANNKELDQKKDDISSASLISITFEDQKNREKNESINLHKTSDKTLCPVKSWAKTLIEFGLMREHHEFRRNNKSFQISNNNIKNALKSTVDTMQAFNLGFSGDDVGTHSIHAGGAMAMVLAKVDTYVIKLQGRWKSDAFMKYIRKQVQQFSSDISDKMILKEHFNHVPKDLNLCFHLN